MPEPDEETPSAASQPVDADETGTGKSPDENTVDTAVVKPLWRRFLRRFVIDAVLIYVIICALITVFQRKLIYVPTTAAELPAPTGSFRTGAIHDVRIETADGLTLGAWLLMANGESAKTEEERQTLLSSGRPLVLFFHGNGGNRDGRELDARMLAASDVNVLLLDYRGYGDSEGSPDEAGLAEDARAAWKLAVEDWQVDPSRIVIYGESLGGGVAVRLASDLCQADKPPAGLILRSTFSSMTDVAGDHYPWLPVWLLLRDRYPSDERIVHVTCPLLMIHGDNDHIVPVQFGRKLFAVAPAAAANGTRKQFLEIARADHNGMMSTDYLEISSAVDAFLRKVAAGE